MAGTQNLKELYENDADFRGYVDRYCKNSHEGKGCSLEDALKHALVRNYADRGKEDEDITNIV